MSHSTPEGESLEQRLARLRSTAETIEHLAAEYHAALRPLREALQAVADAPPEDRGRWSEAVSALARRLSAEGMADVPAILRGVERWGRQFDAGRPECAFPGQAFCAALAAAIAGGSPSNEFFATLEKYTFTTRDAAVQEVCHVLSHLQFVLTERTAPRFTERYRAVLAAAETDGETLRLRLARCDTPLSGEAEAAIYDWDECSTGMRFYRVGICPSASETPPDDEELPRGEQPPPDPVPEGTGVGEGGSPQQSAGRAPRDPNQPGRDRQNDILATIRNTGTPLMQEEIMEEMRLPTVGKLGHQLAWMVRQGILVNIPQRGYWPADDPEPE